MRSFFVLFFGVLFVSSFLFAGDQRGNPSSVPGMLPEVRGDVMFFERNNQQIFVEKECNINGKRYITDVIAGTKSAGQMHATALCPILIRNSQLISESNKEIEVTAYNSDGTTPQVRLCINTCGILNRKGELDKKEMLKRNKRLFGEFVCSSYPCTVENIEPLRVLSFHCFGKESGYDGCTYRGLDKFNP